MTDFPDATEILVTTLASILDTRTERTAGDPLPSAQVRRASGGDDGLSDTARVGVSVFADSETAAADVGKVVARAIRDLAPRFGAQTPVLTDVGEVWVDTVRFIERFRPESYIAETAVYRHRAIVEIGIRLQ